MNFAVCAILAAQGVGFLVRMATAGISSKLALLPVFAAICVTIVWIVALYWIGRNMYRRMDHILFVTLLFVIMLGLGLHNIFGETSWSINYIWVFLFYAPFLMAFDALAQVLFSSDASAAKQMILFVLPVVMFYLAWLYGLLRSRQPKL